MTIKEIENKLRAACYDLDFDWDACDGVMGCCHPNEHLEQVVLQLYDVDETGPDGRKEDLLWALDYLTRIRDSYNIKNVNEVIEHLTEYVANMEEAYNG